MTGINKAILIGHLGRDPEIRNTQGGKKLATFSLASSERWTDKATGEKKERTEWINVVCFNEKIAEVIERFVKKGSKIYVEGKIRTRKYEGKDKIERWVTEVVIEDFSGGITLLDSAGGNRPPPADEASYASPSAAPPAFDNAMPF